MASAPIGLPCCLDQVHLGDFFFERAAGQRHAEDALLERAVFLLEPGGAAVLALVVALDAVVRLVERAGQIRAGVGQLEAFAMPPMVGEKLQLDQTVLARFDGHQVMRIDLVGVLKKDAVLVLLLPGGVRVAQAAYWAARSRGFLSSASASSQRSTTGEGELGQRLFEEGFEIGGYCHAVEGLASSRGMLVTALRWTNFRLTA